MAADHHSDIFWIVRAVWSGLHTEPGIKACTWLREISSCSCLTIMPGPAWLLLNKICVPLFWALYIMNCLAAGRTQLSPKHTISSVCLGMAAFFWSTTWGWGPLEYSKPCFSGKGNWRGSSQIPPCIVRYLGICSHCSITRMKASSRHCVGRQKNNPTYVADDGEWRAEGAVMEMLALNPQQLGVGGRRHLPQGVTWTDVDQYSLYQILWLSRCDTYIGYCDYFLNGRGSA